MSPGFHRAVLEAGPKMLQKDVRGALRSDGLAARIPTLLRSIIVEAISILSIHPNDPICFHNLRYCC